MPWLIGIDEAGYGPNLGPLVMTAVACRVPAEHASGKLWHPLRAAVRRPTQPDDGRLCVDDSKQVFSQTRGLLELEKAVLAAVALPGPPEEDGDLVLADFLGHLSPAGKTELGGEPWYQGTTCLPVEVERNSLRPAAARFHRACEDNSIAWARVRSAIVCPARFNGMVDRWGSKGAVLGLAMTELMRASWNPVGDDEPVAFVIDKHGGRNHYAALLQHALEDGVVLAREENARRSHYEVIGLPRPVTITFKPRADAGHFCVALASMVSKYLREVLMHEFNRFWQGHVSDLKPTAGYPGDSRRFFEQIRPLLPQLQIAETALWRER